MPSLPDEPRDWQWRLHFAAEHCDVGLMRALLDAGADVNVPSAGHSNLTVLGHTLDSEYDGHVQSGGTLEVTTSAYLLARGADPYLEASSGSAADFIRRSDHWLASAFLATWEWLPESAVLPRPVPAKGPAWVHRRFTLHEAVERGDNELLRMLLDEGGDVNEREQGYSLLHHAVQMELAQSGPLRADVTAYLLGRGADPASAAQAALEGDHWIATALFQAWQSRSA